MKNPFVRFNIEDLRASFKAAGPVPHIVIDNFMPVREAKSVVSDYPNFEEALGLGRTFATVNERKKVQISDQKKFSGAVIHLNDALASPEFLADLSYITDIPLLLSDAELRGGGIHMTGPGGRLDVHVDFNFIESQELHRRLNLLLYLNDPWEKEWGGQFELWDAGVKNCEATFDPVFNRCVIFETNEVSYHGVIPVSPKASAPRKSFATYYYTKEAPQHWTGSSHSTIFKARPMERMKGNVLMPAEVVVNGLANSFEKTKRGIKKLIGR